MDKEKAKHLLIETKSLLDKSTFERSSFYSLIKDPQINKDRFHESISTWSYWYSLSYPEFLLCFFQLAGVDNFIPEGTDADAADFQESFLNKVSNLEVSTRGLAKQFGEKMANTIMLQLCFALDFNQRAIARRNRSINDMLEQIRDKVDDYEEIIFEAISIDKSVVTNFEIAEYISRWTICNETKLLKKLSKAIAGKYPRNSRMVALDDHRYMTAVLKDISGEPTPQMVNEMNQLLKTMAEGDDPIRQIRNHLDIRAKDTRKTKRQSSS